MPDSRERIESARECADGTSDADGTTGVDCTDAVRQLYHYLDGELTTERRTLIGQHLDRCGHCTEAAHFEVELRQVIAHRCRDRVPDGLLRRVADAIGQEQRRQGHQ